ncbi:unnamed protein product, partial [Mesorhabditis spiculigera]
MPKADPPSPRFDGRIYLEMPPVDLPQGTPALPRTASTPIIYSAIPASRINYMRVQDGARMMRPAGSPTGVQSLRQLHAGGADHPYAYMSRSASAENLLNEMPRLRPEVAHQPQQHLQQPQRLPRRDMNASGQLMYRVQQLRPPGQQQGVALQSPNVRLDDGFIRPDPPRNPRRALVYDDDPPGHNPPRQIVFRNLQGLSGVRLPDGYVHESPNQPRVQQQQQPQYDPLHNSPYADRNRGLYRQQPGTPNASIGPTVRQIRQLAPPSQPATAQPPVAQSTPIKREPAPAPAPTPAPVPQKPLVPFGPPIAPVEAWAQTALTCLHELRAVIRQIPYFVRPAEKIPTRGDLVESMRRLGDAYNELRGAVRQPCDESALRHAGARFEADQMCDMDEACRSVADADEICHGFANVNVYATTAVYHFMSSPGLQPRMHIQPPRTTSRQAHAHAIEQLQRFSRNFSYDVRVLEERQLYFAARIYDRKGPATSGRGSGFEKQPLNVTFFVEAGELLDVRVGGRDEHFVGEEALLHSEYSVYRSITADFWRNITEKTSMMPNFVQLIFYYAQVYPTCFLSKCAVCGHVMRDFEPPTRFHHGLKQFTHPSCSTIKEYY